MIDMRYLALARFAEGPTDHRFLHPLLLPLAEDLCLRFSHDQVEIPSQVLELHSPRGSLKDNKPRDDRILQAIHEHAEAIDLVIVHTDGGTDPEQARRERVKPALDRLHADPNFRPLRGVAVVPIRETEAWALADGEALRGAFGSTWTDRDLERPRDVEKIADPKSELRRIAERIIGTTRKRRKIPLDNYLTQIAERARLERLRRLRAFQRFENEFREALQNLGIVAE